jgi:hypothetical protein
VKGLIVRCLREGSERRPSVESTEAKLRYDSCSSEKAGSTIDREIGWGEDEVKVEAVVSEKNNAAGR